MKNWRAKEFVVHIDEKFKEAQHQKMSRLDMRWGGWSREMNIILRDRINSKIVDPEQLRLKYVIIYWTTKSQILEYYFRNKMLYYGKIKSRLKEIKILRKAIMTGKGLKEFELTKELASTILDK